MYDTYDILDEKVIIKKKDLKKDLFQDLFQRFSRDILYQKISAEVNKFLPPYVKDNDNKLAEAYFKDLLENDLSEYTQRIFNQMYSIVENCLTNIDELVTKNKEQEEIIKAKEKQIKTLKLKEQFSGFLENSEVLTLEKFQQRKNMDYLKENFARLVSPLI